MQVSVIASGSNGNCCLVEEKDTKILIDAGKSCKEIEQRANNLGKTLDNLDAIFISHSHSDHVIGAGPIARKYNAPIFIQDKIIGNSIFFIRSAVINKFSLKSNISIGNIKIKPIETSHDVPSSGFILNKFGLFTDTGIITESMIKAIKNLKGLLLESNHDIDMLINGRYPSFLKQRILSDKGHLNNLDAANFINTYGNHLDWVLLSHLSQNNNTPEITKKTFNTIVKNKIRCEVMSRDKESGTWEL